MNNDNSRPDKVAADDGLWRRLRRLTAARIGLARSGASLSTGPLLDFRLAHAQARDAVHAELDLPELVSDLAALGLPLLELASAAADKRTYLMRPDLGRVLDRLSESTLQTHAARLHANTHDIVFVISDGLSAGAVQTHAAPVLNALLPGLRTEGWRVAPLVIVRHGRVAIGDGIAAHLHATCVVVLIGERPGLSSPDSMGAYVTWRPVPQTSDAERNCVSNIRPDGMSYADAGLTLAHLMRAMRAHGISGVRLKDTRRAIDAPSSGAISRD